MINAYLRYKEWISRRIAIKSPKTALPILTPSKNIYDIVNAVAHYIRDNFEYNADPIAGGLFDYYTHPETIQYELMKSPDNKAYGLDCDDFSNYAYKMLINHGISPNMVEMVTIVPNLWIKPWDIKWAHVICVIKIKEDYYASIDTNGLKVYKFRTMPDVKTESDKQAVILKEFSRMYKVNYINYVITKYPFL